MKKNQIAKRLPASVVLNKVRTRRAKISLDDVNRFCDLTSNHRLNIQEALAVLGISRGAWESWMARHQEQFADICSRVRGSYIEGRLKVLHSAENGLHGHRADWRSAAHLLAIADRGRYGTNPQQVDVVVQPAIAPATVSSWWPVDVVAKPLPPAPAPKQLAAPAQPPTEPQSKD